MKKYVFHSPCKVLKVGLGGFTEEVSGHLPPGFVSAVNHARKESLVGSSSLSACMWREEVQGLVLDVSIEFFEEDQKLMLETIVCCSTVMQPEQIEAMMRCLTGQFSDGWGENFEQRPIKHEDTTYYVATWFYGETQWEIKIAR